MRRRLLNKAATLTLSSYNGSCAAKAGSYVSFTVYYNDAKLTDTSLTVTYSPSSAVKSTAFTLSTSVLKVTCNANTSATSNRTINITIKYRGLTETYVLTQNKMTIDDTSMPYVDLGLSSGTLWAKYNVSATSETAYGEYYTWGARNNTEASPYVSSSTPKTLPLSNDIMNLTYGGKWHIPTVAQFKELLSATTSAFTYVSGGYVIKCTKKNDSSKYIYLLPARTKATKYRKCS